VAAEIATVAPQFFNKMVLVGATGIKPERGEIFDYFLEGGLIGLRRAFHRPEQSFEFMRYWGKEWTPEEADLVEQHREMTCRIAWKPYMHTLTLRHLLPSARTPTLLVWGREDAITPVECGEIYQRAIPRSRLTVIENCVHMPEMEKAGRIREAGRNFPVRLSKSRPRMPAGRDAADRDMYHEAGTVAPCCAAD
jgi:pimeloyl-ACP methyl ester carboxylesterase